MIDLNICIISHFTWIKSKKIFISFSWVFFSYFFIPKSLITSLNSPSITLASHGQPSSMKVIRSFVAAANWSMEKRVLFKMFYCLSSFRCIGRWWYQFDSCILTSVRPFCLDCICFDLIEGRRACILDRFIQIAITRVMIACCIDTSDSWMNSFGVSRLSIGWVPWSYIQTLIESNCIILEPI